MISTFSSSSANWPNLNVTAHQTISPLERYCTQLTAHSSVVCIAASHAFIIINDKMIHWMHIIIIVHGASIWNGIFDPIISVYTVRLLLFRCVASFRILIWASQQHIETWMGRRSAEIANGKSNRINNRALLGIAFFSQFLGKMKWKQLANNIYIYIYINSRNDNRWCWMRHLSLQCEHNELIYIYELLLLFICEHATRMLLHIVGREQEEIENADKGRTAWNSESSDWPLAVFAHAIWCESCTMQYHRASSFIYAWWWCITAKTESSFLPIEKNDNAMMRNANSKQSNPRWDFKFLLLFSSLLAFYELNSLKKKKLYYLRLH